MIWFILYYKNGFDANELSIFINLLNLLNFKLIY